MSTAYRREKGPRSATAASGPGQPASAYQSGDVRDLQTASGKPAAELTDPDDATVQSDQLIPDWVVKNEFRVCSMTLWRWTEDQQLGFPQPVKIRGRNYRRRRQVDTFKARMIREALAQALRGDAS
jgi:hypothetical protein